MPRSSSPEGTLSVAWPRALPGRLRHRAQNLLGRALAACAEEGVADAAQLEDALKRRVCEASPSDRGRVRVPTGAEKRRNAELNQRDAGLVMREEVLWALCAASGGEGIETWRTSLQELPRQSYVAVIEQAEDSAAVKRGTDAAVLPVMRDLIRAEWRTCMSGCGRPVPSGGRPPFRKPSRSSSRAPSRCSRASLRRRSPSTCRRTPRRRNSTPMRRRSRSPPLPSSRHRRSQSRERVRAASGDAQRRRRGRTPASPTRRRRSGSSPPTHGGDPAEDFIRRHRLTGNAVHALRSIGPDAARSVIMQLDMSRAQNPDGLVVSKVRQHPFRWKDDADPVRAFIASRPDLDDEAREALRKLPQDAGRELLLDIDWATVRNLNKLIMAKAAVWARGGTLRVHAGRRHRSPSPGPQVDEIIIRHRYDADAGSALRALPPAAVAEIHSRAGGSSAKAVAECVQWCKSRKLVLLDADRCAATCDAADLVPTRHVDEHSTMQRWCRDDRRGSCASGADCPDVHVKDDGSARRQVSDLGPDALGAKFGVDAGRLRSAPEWKQDAVLRAAWHELRLVPGVRAASRLEALMSGLSDGRQAGADTKRFSRGSDDGSRDDSPKRRRLR